MVILLIISILGLSLLAANIKAVRPSESPLISLSAAIILLYSFAIFGLLDFGAYFVLALGLAAYPLTLIYQRKNIKAFLKRLAGPGFAVFAALAVALYFICRPIVTGAWDEYSHWALIVRNMLMTGGLPRSGGAVLYITYPPATPLFQYMFMKAASCPEGMMYYAQSVLIAAALAAMLKGQSYRKPLTLLLSFVLPVLAVVKFSVHNIFNIFPDYLMAVMAAAAFVMYYKSERRISDALKLLPVMFMLSLVRTNAIMFAVFALFSMGAVLASERSFKKKFMHILLPFASGALGILSWQIYIKATGAEAVLGGGTPFFPVDAARLVVILDNFKSALFFTKLGTVYQPIYLASSAMAFAFMAAALTVIIHFMLKKDEAARRRVLYVNISFFILFAVYCISLILGYQCLFTEPEAMSLASYSRYMGTFFMFWIISVFFVIVDLAAGQQETACKKKKAFVAICAAVIVALAVLTHPTMLNILGGRRFENPYEQEAQACAAEIQSSVGTEAKVYLIFQKSRGYSFMGTRYQLGTNPANLGTWSLGAPYSDSDTWTVALLPEDFLQRLYDLDYEYVYVAGGGDTQLWEGYGMLFDAPDSGHKIFKVTDDAGAPLKAAD